MIRVKIQRSWYDVSLSQTSKTAWEAVGMGPTAAVPGASLADSEIRVQGRTENDALNKWKMAAKYKLGL